MEGTVLMDHVQELLTKYGQNDQRTAEWHAKRGTMLTASEIYKALPDATPSQKHELVMSKLTPRPKTEGSGPRALVWGTRFEPIAKEIYCKVSSEPISIVDTTCIPHPAVEFLGASPDGIILSPGGSRDCRLVEFKCPISRTFSDETPVPVAYYHQMQLQMECTQLNTCEYIEFQFRTPTYTEWKDSTAEYKGFYAVTEDDMQVKYHDLLDTRDPSTWRAEVLGDVDDWNILYWTLEKYCVKIVQHETDWLAKNLPSMTEVWNTILDHRKNGTLPEHPKEKTTLTL
jgi:putative phage-type endonuclease